MKYVLKLYIAQTIVSEVYYKTESEAIKKGSQWEKMSYVNKYEVKEIE